MTAGSPVRVALLAGTRPEVVKLAPILFEMRRRPRAFHPVWVATGQHPALHDQACEVFGIVPDVRLAPVPDGHSLAARGAALLSACDGWLADHPAEAVLVQGDTSSAIWGAWAAFYRGIPVAHVEAGLRTGDASAPFPEEVHRRSLATLARWSFAPTSSAQAHLLAEGVEASSIVVTGNTVVDAVHWMQAHPVQQPPSEAIQRLCAQHRTVLVTAHRRENLPHGLTAICRAIRTLLEEDDTLACVFPVHRNPEVQAIVATALGGVPRVVCCDPLPYPALAWLLAHSACVVSDSGGLQEEAPSYGTRVVLCRTNTERPEGVQEGSTILAGTDVASVLASCRMALRLPAWPGTSNPFGDGRAASRICDVLEGPSGVRRA